MKEIVKEIISALNASGKNKTSPYDVKGKVKRIEGKIAWVRLNGGIDETPVQRTINCKPGDTVQVRVSGGGAWITGNMSAPPTDDTVAKKALHSAGAAMGAAETAQEGVDEINDIIEGGELTVVKVVIEHILSTSRSQLIPYNDMAWSETLPTYVSGCFYWIRTATYYADGTVKYSTPVYDMASQVSAEADIAADNAAQAAETAAGIAEDALALAGAKKRVFNSTPTTPYDKGDLWFDGVHGKTYLCTTARSSGSYSSSDWTLYSTDVSNHFWYDSSGAHIAENAGDVSTGASQTIASAGTVIMRNGKLVTSWTGSSHSNAALNFYDCSNATASVGDLVASYARAGITMYINNKSAMALTASGLSFYSPDSNHYTEAIFGSSGVQLYANNVMMTACTSSGVFFYDSNGALRTKVSTSGLEVFDGTVSQNRVANFGSEGTSLGYGGAEYFTINASGDPTPTLFEVGSYSNSSPSISGNTRTIELIIPNNSTFSSWWASLPTGTTFFVSAQVRCQLYNSEIYTVSTVAYDFVKGTEDYQNWTPILIGGTVQLAYWNTSGGKIVVGVTANPSRSYLTEATITIGEYKDKKAPSFALGTSVISGDGTFVCGRFNSTVNNPGAYAFIIGNGSSGGQRSDAMHVDWGGNTEIAGTLTQGSDRRLKEHISYLDSDAIQFIQSLMPAHYLKDDMHHVGFYAQDVKEIDPWDCMTGEMNGYMTLGYTEIIAPLVKYCQHLEERIADLESQKGAA